MLIVQVVQARIGKKEEWSCKENGGLLSWNRKGEKEVRGAIMTARFCAGLSSVNCAVHVNVAGALKPRSRHVLPLPFPV